jgi:hypothetical protein
VHRQREEDSLTGSVPDAPLLGDFLCDDTNVVSSYFCSESSKNIESEILDAVQDDEECLQIENENEHSSEHEICDSDSRTVQTQLENISLADNKVILPTDNVDNISEFQELENFKKSDNAVGTELQEIHSYAVAITDSSSVEADTRLESPRRSIVNHPYKCDSHEAEELVSAHASAPTDMPATEANKTSIPEIVPLSVTSVKIDNESKIVTFPKEDVKNVKPAISKSINDVNHLEAVVHEIRPFTEAQLSSLYSNRELEMNAEFVSEFVENHLRESQQQHHLYELLVSYFRVRNRLIVNVMDLEALKKECVEHQNNLWMIETSVVSDSGECQDGNPVSASHEYKVSQFSKTALSLLTRSLVSVKELVNEVHSLNSYTSEVLRLQIEHYVQSVANSCPELLRLPHNAPANLHVGEPPPHVAPCFLELRTCIAILFTFQRRLVKDSQFVSDTRDWLSRLVAVLLRVASWRDHLFVLNHVLRCPADVGSWAAGYIQVPPPPIPGPCGSSASPFASCHLDHMMAVLATILLPIREREHFLEQVKAKTLFL